MNIRIHHRGDRPATVLTLQLAATPWTRLRGLLGQPAPGPRQGLWIRPCNSVHCWFMRFAIDVLYLDNRGLVLDIRHNLRPWSFSVCWKAASVVELSAGECRRLEIEPGDRLQCDA